MDFKEKKKISHFWDNFSRAAFFIPEDPPKNIFFSAYQPQVKVDQNPSIKPF